MTGTIREESAPRHKRLLHSWVAPLIRIGRQRPLTLDDLYPLPPREDSPAFNAAAFRAAFSDSLVRALFITFKQKLIRIFILLTFITLLGLLRPLLLREFIGRFSRRSGNTYSNIFTFVPDSLSLAIFGIACFLVLAFVRTHFLRLSFKMTWAMPGLLRHEVYQKLLTLPPSQRAKLTTGEYVNIATRDCDSTSMLAFLLEPLLYPLTIVAYCGMLVYFLGPWALLAVVALAAIIPAGRRLEARMRALASAIREQARLRVGILSEVLSGIRVIKFHAWEEKFEQRVMSIREKEVELMRRRARVTARHSALTSLLPILTGAAVVTLVAWLSGVPSTADVFASFSVIASLVTIFSEAPDLIQSVSELRVSMKRIADFLAQPAEKSIPAKGTGGGIEITQGFFSRSAKTDSLPQTPALSNISLSVRQGQSVAVVGGVGSGKSTLISALLGELQLISGDLQLPDRTVYAPQTAWNRNATVKENIIFELPFQKDIFGEVLFASALQQDIQQWAGGIESEVGERGINLSGGQKQRLALARTIYSSLQENIKTVIWDDPFSALDESVANHVFTEGFENLLRNRTRIFATHRIDFALRSDHVVVMKSGQIAEQGAPQDLIKTGGAFAQLMELHNQTRGHKIFSGQNTEIKRTSDDQPATDAGKLMTEEKIVLPIFNKTALNTYMKALAPALGLIGVASVFLLPRLADIGSNLWLGYWTSNSQSVALSQAMLVFGGLTFATVMTERARTLVLFDGGVRAGTVFFKNLVQGVFNAPMRFFDTSPQGRVLNRFTSDTTTIDSSMPSSVGQFLASAVGIFASVLPVVWSQPKTGLMLIPACFLYVWLFKAVRGAQLRLNALSQVVRSPWMSMTAETLPGLSVIRSQRAEDRFMVRYRELIDRHISTGFYVVAVNLWFAFRLEILGVALVGGFILAMTFAPVGSSTTLAAVGLTFSLQMVGILGGVARSLRMLENALVSVDRVNEYSMLLPESTPEPLEVPQGWPLQGKIELRSLSASYDSSQPAVLNDISVSIPSGGKIGLVGRTGSGKSTLFLALTRMLPVRQKMIFIDGVDIAHVPLKRLRQSISMIPQDPVLFSGTLRENLDPFGTYPDSDIDAALRRAHLEHICPHADAAAAFQVEENGRNLSVGERQLVCLARALLSRSRILLIDEATANVDVATDAKIQQTLREEFNDCTRLVIAHRTNTLNDADVIFQLDKGRLAQISQA
jgi:ABC-type multidrug transport system fused ATPase/permease subunit